MPLSSQIPGKCSFCKLPDGRYLVMECISPGEHRGICYLCTIEEVTATLSAILMKRSNVTPPRMAPLSRRYAA